MSTARLPQSGVVIHEDELAVESWEDRPESTITWKTLTGVPERATDSLTCGIATLVPGGVVERHRHSHAEVYYFTAGSGIVQVNEDVFAVRVGSCVFIPGNVHHRIENTGDVDLRLFYSFATDRFTDVVYQYD
jgi:mannose-6-phosphate isomerase-like protein (cupin superfamily)